MHSMSFELQLATAIAVASTAHLNQTDKGGNPYILHPIKVMHYLKTKDMELMAIAVMHDVVEDSDHTIQGLREMGFSERILDGVDRVTKKEGQTPEEYFERICGSRDAIRVKLADLRHNTDIRRLKGVSDKDLLRMRKYHGMYKKLEIMLNAFDNANSI